MKPDFSGYATKAGLKCSDGRTIMPEAFKHMDGKKVPLVWQHGHSSPDNVLGHAVLEAREDGVYAYGYFNGTQSATNARQLVQHEDIKNLSIYANQLVERTKQVFHGVIREVSLVLSGANPGALIDHVAIQHSDGSTDVLDDEAVIYTGLDIQHDDENQNGSDSFEHEDDDDPDEETVRDVYDSLDDKQKDVVHYMIGAALEAAGKKPEGDSAKQSAMDDGVSHQEGSQEMNVFENNKGTDSGTDSHELTHDAMRGIFEDAQKRGSLMEAVEHYALQHGINDISTLFPEPKMQGDQTPEWIKRRTEWVSGVINGVRSNPFTRLKTRTADLTLDEARAKGYVTGNMKKEQFFGLAQRTTGPQTIYKKQKLDRDDILDITDFDVVAWIKGEMRIMLEEEVARAILFGDGREVEDEDKIKDPAGAPAGDGIRSILNDHEFYAHPVTVPLNVDEDGNVDYEVLVESIARSRRFYKGTGTPTFFTTEEIKTEMLLSKDKFGRRRYQTEQELAAALRVSSVVAVEAMETLLEPIDETTPAPEPDLLGVIVNLRDYSVGTDKGGQLTWFDDFDIDYNQYKYLIEGRMSGALVHPKSALVLRSETLDAPHSGLSTTGHEALSSGE